LPKSIVSLELQHNKLDNINGINKFTNLETLKLEFNSLEDNDLEKLS
jgi:Leucine-rich repeat (LRR) protein